jgi:hypothetical protein
MRAALLAALLFSSLSWAQTVTFDPATRDLELDPGQTMDVTIDVCLPGVVTKADIYLLADTTTSMTPILDQLKLDAVQIVSTLLATPGADIQVGLGQYRDFPWDTAPFPYDHQVSPTTDQTSLVNAINTWSAGGGGDGSEGQFYALHQLSTDPIVNWRPDAKRIVVWFGDSPGHDPICAFFVGGGVPTFDIDEALVTSVLQAGGPGGTAVIAIGVPTGYPNALNDDPLLFADDYTNFCTPGGTPGQADRIALATGGISTSVADPVQITQAILNTVNAVLNDADVDLVISGDIQSFVTDVQPGTHQDVTLPADPKDEICVQYVVTLTGPPCEKGLPLFTGEMEVQLDTVPVATHEVTITQPACYDTVGTLFVGRRRTEMPLPGGGPEDLLLVEPDLTFIVDLTDIPPLRIPDIPSLFGFRFYMQCTYLDELSYPADPVLTSNLIAARLGYDIAHSVGPGSGLALSLRVPPVLGGSVQPVCLILGPP